MQPALKDVGSMSSLPGLSLLTGSPLWNQPINKIAVEQLHAFVTRHTQAGKRDEAETAIELCIGEVCKAIEAGQIQAPAMLSYSPPFRHLMTAGELRIGLESLRKEKAAAILFALEAGISAQAVGFLTWPVAMRLIGSATLSPLAKSCLAACPRQIRLQNVFWRIDEEFNLPTPLMQLEFDVFEAFGLVWGELEQAYARLIMIDGSADKATVEELLKL